CVCSSPSMSYTCFFFQAEDGIRDRNVTGVQTCALPISRGLYTPATAGILPVGEAALRGGYLQLLGYKDLLEVVGNAMNGVTFRHEGLAIPSEPNSTPAILPVVS